MMVSMWTCPSCWRQIPIPKEDIGYRMEFERGGIKTQILETKREVAIVFRNVSRWTWNNPKQLWKAFEDSNFDQNTENIVILRDFKGTTAVRVYLKTPIYNPSTQTLECNLQVIDPGGIAGFSMAFYGWAIAYNTDKIKRVTWNGKLVEHLFDNKNKNKKNKNENKNKNKYKNIDIAQL